ncbi:hypothetical protein BU24DRAFT_88516 [Aaosphaeria arxii CBS 175.79]|uniref:Uncharacterized protein n=1 Tax=Aaosphaeria arxii CBS 175.79 TaxID=1450172 RepID=A0A6A5X7Z1_9PLEO|nr:uncharacterized protein BU24DRAFT_88516 [Aaosphaeria arxii CBS 175.79]KAF2008927.1 hypothetical protein BU24DRAFT_88516 [Aaosphaeria arxii CBS 175.79]
MSFSFLLDLHSICCHLRYFLAFYSFSSSYFFVHYDRSIEDNGTYYHLHTHSHSGYPTWEGFGSGMEVE